MKLYTFAAAMTMAAGAFAQGVFTGTLDAADPVFNRPLATGTGLSGVGTAVAYETYTWTPTTAGTAIFEMGSEDFDTFIFAYQPSFDPLAPLGNFLVGQDDFFGTPTYIASAGFMSRITGTVAAGSPVVVVATTFGNGEVGNYEVAFNQPTPPGPGDQWDGELTASSPTWDRPLESGATTTFAGALGVHYETNTFTVSADGSYTIEMGKPVTTGNVDMDTFVFVYNPFNPADNQTGFVAGDDDYAGNFQYLNNADYQTGSLERSKIEGVTLQTGQTYVAVATAYNSTAVHESTFSVGVQATPGNSGSATFTGGGGGTTVSGTITVANGGAALTSVEIQFRDAATLNNVGSPITVPVDGSGNFSVTAPGNANYDITMMPTSSLRRTVNADTTGGSVSGLAITIIPGNFVMDGQIDISDYLALSESFDENSFSLNWTVPNSSGVTPEAIDVDNSDAVDLGDYLVMSAGFDQTGDN